MPRRSLAQRVVEPEHLDDPANSADEVAALHRHLGRLNRLFRFARPFQLFLPPVIGERCHHLDLLDVGAGSGELGQVLTAWAARRGWTWRITSLDASACALQLDNGNRRVVGSALELPFADQSFDCVIASQMTHHIASDAEIVRHFREAWRVTRNAVFFSDLYRHVTTYWMVWSCALLIGCSRRLRSDGLTSVARGFRVPEWQAFARNAGFENFRVSTYFGARILLHARKSHFADSSGTLSA